MYQLNWWLGDVPALASKDEPTESKARYPYRRGANNKPYTRLSKAVVLKFKGEPRPWPRAV